MPPFPWIRAAEPHPGVSTEQAVQMVTVIIIIPGSSLGPPAFTPVRLAGGDKASPNRRKAVPFPLFLLPKP